MLKQRRGFVMKKVLLFISVCLLAAALTGCASIKPTEYRRAPYEYDDHSYKVNASVKSEGKIAYDKDKTFKDILMFWYKYPEAVRNATEDDIVIYTRKRIGGFFTLEVFEIPFKSWTGQFDIVSKGNTKGVKYTAKGTNVHNIDFVVIEDDDTGFYYENHSNFETAPALASIYNAPDGRNYYLQKTEEYKTEFMVIDLITGTDRRIPCRIPENSKIQITDEDNLVLAEVDIERFQFTIYQTASDEDEENICNFIGMYYSWLKFKEYCEHSI